MLGFCRHAEATQASKQAEKTADQMEGDNHKTDKQGEERGTERMNVASADQAGEWMARIPLQISWRVQDRTKYALVI